MITLIYMLPKECTPYFEAVLLDLEHYTTYRMNSDPLFKQNEPDSGRTAWNETWRRFAMSNPGPNAEDIHRQLLAMMKRMSRWRDAGKST
jgi:hypothetical protein